MDRRIRKSKNALIHCYLDLTCKNDGIEPMVIEICEAADVNKTTFYRHYRNIDELRLEAEEVLAKQVIGEAAGFSFAKESPEKYVRWSIERFSKFQDRFIAFKNHPQEFLSVMERVTIDIYKKKYNKDVNPIVLDFIGGGLVRTFMINQPDENVIITVSKILTALFALRED